jgi:hypothetical protein
LTFYVDGVALTTDIVTPLGSGFADIAGTLKVGRQVDQVWYFGGLLDEIRVSKGLARYTTDFTPDTAPFTSDANTQLLLHMEDSTDDGNTGHTITRKEVSFGGFDLDGSAGYVNVDALMTDIKSDTTGSFSVWMKADVLTGPHWVGGFADTSAFQYFTFGQSTNRFYFEIFIDGANGTTWNVIGADGIPDNDWHHFVITQDGVAAKIYKDGVDVTPTPVLNGTGTIGDWLSIVPNIDNGRIGCQNVAALGNIQFFDGHIDDFRYYQNVVLSEAQVIQLYNSGLGTEALGFL